MTKLVQTAIETGLQVHSSAPVEYNLDDVKREYAAIRGSVGIFDFSAHGKFKVSGENHIPWLSHLISRDLEFMNSERSAFALCLNDESKVLGILTLYKYDESIWVETDVDARERIAAWFSQHQEDGVEVEDISDGYDLIGLEGPSAFKVAQSLIDFEISSIPFQGFVDIEWQDTTVLLARTGYTGEYGYKLFVPAEQGNALWNELLAQVQTYGGASCGYESLTIAMLEVRQPIGEIETGDLPLVAAGLGWLVDFHKSDEYIGQDAVRRQYEQPFTHRSIGFVAHKEAGIEAGDQVVLGQQVIGHVLIARYSPTLDAILGLALNEEPFTVPNQSWHIQTAGGDICAVQSVSSPYVTPKSWKVKML